MLYLQAVTGKFFENGSRCRIMLAGLVLGLFIVQAAIYFAQISSFIL